MVLSTLDTRRRMSSFAPRRPGGFFHAREVAALVVITSPDMLLTRAEAAEVAGVGKERLRQWERRGHLERAGLTEQGWPLYRALDVARCKHRFHGCARDEAAA